MLSVRKHLRHNARLKYATNKFYKRVYIYIYIVLCISQLFHNGYTNISVEKRGFKAAVWLTSLLCQTLISKD